MLLEKSKRIGIIAIIAILFALLSFSIVDVFIEGPKYENFCPDNIMAARPMQKNIQCPEFKEPTSEETVECSSRGGMIDYTYDATGCPSSYKCNMCVKGFNDAGKQYRFIGFVITSILGVIAIIVGMYVKSSREVVGWIFSGILIGGILSVAFGTISYFHDMGRFTKPVILLVELAIIIWIAVRTAKK